jgi:hypothetical protein
LFFICFDLSTGGRDDLGQFWGHRAADLGAQMHGDDRIDPIINRSAAAQGRGRAIFNRAMSDSIGHCRAGIRAVPAR